MGTRKKDRFFAGFGAILFLVTSSALTILVIWTSTHSSNDASTAATDQSKQTACSDTGTETTLALPTVYKTSSVSSLQTTDLTTGTGAAAKTGDCLVVKYYGTLATSGTEFDENFDKPTAIAFTLGAQQVIPGWEQGLVGMKVGGERRLVIPAKLGYGSTGSCRTYDTKDTTKCDDYAIPPNSGLVFDVKLLRIQ